MLLRQGPGSNKLHGAVKVVEVVAYDHLKSFRTTQGSINLLEERNWTLVFWSTRGDLQFHIIDVLTLDNVSNMMILADKCSINGTFDTQLILHSLGVIEIVRASCRERVFGRV